MNIKDIHLLIDPGIHSYNKGDHYNYYRSSKAHNVLIIDDQNFEVNIDNTGLSGITRYYSDFTYEYSDEKDIVHFVEMTHPHYAFLDLELYRQFLLIGTNTFAIKDIIITQNSHKFSQYYHLAPGASIIEKNGKIVITWPYHNYNLIITSDYTYFDVIRGQINPLLGWYYPSFNKTAETTLLRLHKSGQNCSLLSIFEVSLSGISHKENIEFSVVNDMLSQIANVVERNVLIKQQQPDQWKIER